MVELESQKICKKMQRLWMWIVKYPHPLYEIARREIGNLFLKIQTALFKGVCEYHWNSEKTLIFAACMFTRESRVVFTPAIRKLITTRLDKWEQGKICALVLAVESEAKRGAGKRPNAVGDEELFQWAATVGQNI